MLDIKFVRDHIDEVQEMLVHRNNPLKLDGFRELDKKRRDILKDSESLKAERNAVSPLVIGAATIPNKANNPPTMPSQSLHIIYATLGADVMNPALRGVSIICEPGTGVA